MALFHYLFARFRRHWGIQTTIMDGELSEAKDCVSVVSKASFSIPSLYTPQCCVRDLIRFCSVDGMGYSYDGVRCLAGPLRHLAAALLDANMWHLLGHVCHGRIGSPLGSRCRQICDRFSHPACSCTYNPDHGSLDILVSPCIHCVWSSTSSKCRAMNFNQCLSSKVPNLTELTLFLLAS